MLKICDKSICKPPEPIFNCFRAYFLAQGTFPFELKKANVVPIHSTSKTIGLSHFSQYV